MGIMRMEMLAKGHSRGEPTRENIWRGVKLQVSMVGTEEEGGQEREGMRGCWEEP